MPIFRIGRNTPPTDIQSVGDFLANPLSLDNPPDCLYNKDRNPRVFTKNEVMIWQNDLYT